MKRIGCCTLCEKPVFEILAKWTQGPMKGEPRRIGRPTTAARRVHYLLSDGSSMPLTFCADCVERALAPESFPMIWGLVLEAFGRELTPEYVAAINAPPRTEKQQAAVEAFVARLANESIVGTAGIEKLDELLYG